MKEKYEEFNYLEIKKLLTETPSIPSFRKLAPILGIHRNVLDRVLNGKSKGGLKDEAWDILINLFAQENICICKSDFYYSVYLHENMPENKVADEEDDKNENEEKEFVPKEDYDKLMEAYKDRTQKVVDLNKLIEQLKEKLKSQKNIDDQNI